MIITEKSDDQAPLAMAWLGRASYRAVWALQEELRRRIIAAEAPETLLLLEHAPVITLGKNADAHNVLRDESALAQAGVELVRTNRGGDVTYHGPGQLVAYPIVHLTHGIVAHVKAMAEAVLDVAAPYGVSGEFRRDFPGVWVNSRKLCAFGVHVHRHVAIHGLALNLTIAPSAFSLIVPCGLADKQVTSLAELIHPLPAPTPAELAPKLGAALAARLERRGQFLAPDALTSLLYSA